MTAYDVVVIGGGVAGGAAALALAKAGRAVLLLEAEPTVRWRIGETLAPEARRALGVLGVWDSFRKASHSESHGIVSAWGNQELVEQDLICNPYGNAWQLDRVEFERSLLAAAENAGCQVLRGALVETMVRNGGGWEVCWGAQQAACQCLVDATGRRSMVARHLGLKRKMLDQLVAIYGVATSARSTDVDGRTLIESCENGWWYSALMPGGRRTVSFQTDADLLHGQDWRHADWLIKAIAQTQHLRALLTEHDYTFESPPQLTSAHSGCLACFQGEGWVAVGDSAMSFDPLSGQGISKALQSGIEAAKVVCDPASQTCAEFTQWNEEHWQNFCRSRKEYYRMERRWGESAFWQRRQSLQG